MHSPWYAVSPTWHNHHRHHQHHCPSLRPRKVLCHHFTISVSATAIIAIATNTIDWFHVLHWYALSASLFCVARNHPYEVSAISMGAFLSATSPASSSSVHGAGMLASSSSSYPLSANCWYSTRLFACPRRLLGHWGAWLEWTISEEITRCEITIKWIWKL